MEKDASRKGKDHSKRKPNDSAAQAGDKRQKIAAKKPDDKRGNAGPTGESPEKKKTKRDGKTPEEDEPESEQEARSMGFMVGPWL